MSALFAARGCEGRGRNWRYNLVDASGLTLALERHCFAAFGLRDRPEGNTRRAIEPPDRPCGDSMALVNQWNQRVLSAFL
jgi:hypothetical protein